MLEKAKIKRDTLDTNPWYVHHLTHVHNISHVLTLRIVVELASPGDEIAEMEGFSGLIYG